MIIKIKNFRAKIILGIYEWEQNFEREIIINAEIHTKHDKARFSNDLKDTIDYDTIINKIKNLINNKKFQLLEKLTQEVLDLIMEDKKIKKCIIEIDKVKVINEVESFSVKLMQSRKSWI